MARLMSCPGCGRNCGADEGHHLCRECEGYPARTDAATLTARIEVLQECVRRLVTTYQQPQSAWQAGSPCAVEFALAMGETPERES